MIKEFTFEQIKGYEEEKKELLNLCYIIKNRDKLNDLGGKLPRGVFLLGPNGVGKTMLANAFIKEAHCNKVIVNHNDINNDSKFLKYIKSKFKKAASKSPCILFIDEFDKLVGNSEKMFVEDNFDRSLIILNEINKYIDVPGFFLLICGNQQLAIDDSVIRSGRIDKIININLPDQNDRKEIINYYSKGKSFEQNVNLDNIAKITKGFSGADIESLLNNALIKSFTAKRKEISNSDMMSEYYEMIFSLKSKNPILNDESLKEVAVHEAGHAVVNLILDKEGVTNVNILSSGDVRGFANSGTNEEKVYSLDDIKNRIVIALAGMVAEELVIGKRNDGSKNDIKKAREMTKTLICNDGYFGIEYTDASYVPEGNPVFSTMMARIPKNKSESLLEKLEELENKLINECKEEAKRILIKNKELHSALTKQLLEKKILNREDINKIVLSIQK